MDDFDVLVIGSGPSGQKAAIAAAKLDRRVGLVERPNMLGGVCLNTGTIPSKTLREAVLYLTGLDQREMYGQSYHVKEEIAIGDLTARTHHVVSREADVVRNQLTRNRVAMLTGSARFTGPKTVDVEDGDGRSRTITADKIIIATGTQPARPASVKFDGRTIIDSDGVLELDRIPRSMIVAGAGVIGIEYVSMFAALGTKVTVIEQRDRMLEFCDLEVVEALKYHLRDLAVTFRFGETVTAVESRAEGAIAELASGKRILAETVMYSAGRQGMTADLDLEAAGLGADGRGRITVDEFYRTTVPTIYAVGDVIGFPALAATSMEQGRLAAHHACGESVHNAHLLQPIGIYSIPEISFIGKTEDQLTAGVRAVRGRRVPVPRAGPRPDHRRLLRRAEAAGLAAGPHAARRARVRDRRHRAGAHRAGGDGLRRHRRLPGGRRVQLPDPGRVVQGGGAGRDQQDAPGRAVLA